MKSTVSCALILALAALATADGDLEIRWAGSVVTGTSPPLTPAGALGAPDGAQAQFWTPDAEATYGEFADVSSYGRDALSTLLGVSLETLGRTDILAFERAGTPNLVFENSTWTFSSGPDVEVVVVPGGVTTGNVSVAAYGSFFAFTPPPGGDWPFALFELQTVDPLAADFTVNIRRGPTVEGTPDLDAIGVVPEPATLLIVTAAGLPMLLKRRRNA